MFRQLSAWTLYGMLTDPCLEFFIQENDSSSTDSRPSLSTEEDDGPTKAKEKQYSLRPEMLPSYISSNMADKILFVGEAVCMLASTSSSSPFGISDEPSSVTASSIYQERQEEFGNRLYELAKKEEFLLFDFESIVIELRNHAAKTLWRLVVEEGDLLGHLRTLKELFLLGHGELFLCLLDQAGPILRLPATPRLEQSAGLAFQLAARQLLPITPSGETVADKFTLTFNHTGKSKQETGWSCIGLKYEVSSPLSMLLTPFILSRYNTMFHFLLGVQRVQRELHLCWLNQTKSQTFSPLRFHMAFLVDSLQYYLQVDVLESNFLQLQDKVRTIQDFESIQLAHEQFLSDIVTQSFLLLKPVYTCLQEILDQCLAYCHLVSTGYLTQEQLEQRTKDFSKQTELLILALSTLHRYHSLPHLAQLLLRINYNRFFSPSA